MILCIPLNEPDLRSCDNLQLAQRWVDSLYRGKIMGQQLRTVAKRRRRAAYLDRKKEAVKVAAATKTKK